MNKTSAAHKIPESLVSKITLMAYGLNPHPLAQIIKKSIDTEYKIALSFVKNVLQWGDKDIQRVKDDVKRNPIIKLVIVNWVKSEYFIGWIIHTSSITNINL